jgi:hypothetical protein
MSVKKLMLTVYKQNHIRDDWKVDLEGENFRLFISQLQSELAAFGMEVASSSNDALTVNVNSYADLLNAVRISSPVDGFANKCIGHIIGKSQHLDFFEDIRRAVNRVAFAPETIPPDDHNRKVCHNCGCGC